jgi:hypothetical protein
MRKKMKNQNQNPSQGHSLIFFTLMVSILFLSCQVQKAKTEEKDIAVYNGVGCGTIHPEYGDIRVLSKIESSTFLFLVLRNKHTTLESGELILESQDSMGEVFMLDFNTNKKVYDIIVPGMKGYIFPCSDIVVDSHVPDTLPLIEGKLKMTIQTLEPNNKRIYFINIENAKFSNGDKIKYVKGYKGKINFTRGDPG